MEFSSILHDVFRPNGADCPLYVNQKNKQPRIDEKTPDETLQESRCIKINTFIVRYEKKTSNTQQPRKPIKTFSKTANLNLTFMKQAAPAIPG
jgi:hypothetical protein